ncbi:ATP-dependent RNA helicase DDX19/DBP5 [Nematocida sp. LUAm3]|nr:ATP-dependent RNA helicase DDX19/DBP5 [Nematocida sp. LUAm3]KAI5174876.1 ATP-dependent RNA helicase DDX19/DBP5 [Nematocida sp. LUAm2]KAI5177526.1 ATP-dependent RNA helicase DDX19/DBP5 [Nematocida sp. LUAm1]
MTEASHRKEIEKDEDMPSDVKAAMKMFQQMEICKKENESEELYKESLLSSELVSKSTFEQIKVPEDITKALYAMEFKQPSVIQEKAIPEIAKKINVAFQSQSGSGKTIAFLIGAIMALDRSKSHPQVLIISPTRDLAMQIYQVLERFKKNLDFTSLLALKDKVDRDTVINEHIVIGSPGTMKSLTNRQIDLKQIKMIILDEADALLSQGTGADIASIVKKSPNKQLVLFSATFNKEMKSVIEKLTDGKITSHYTESDKVKPENISQFYIEVENKEKIKTLKSLFELISSGQSIIFAETRATVEYIVKAMKEDGFDVGYLHGLLSPEDRDKILKSFKEGEIRLLVTTNVLSRGIDIPQLNFAINYDFPVTQTKSTDIETYVHRIGRTGRFNRAGVSITFIAGQQDMNHLINVQKEVGDQMQLVTLGSMEKALIRFNEKKEQPKAEDKKEDTKE